MQKAPINRFWGPVFNNFTGVHISTFHFALASFLWGAQTPQRPTININNNNNNNNHNDNSNSIEVVFFHAWPEQFYAELIHNFCLNGLLDLTAGSGHAAMATIKAKKTYVGLCLSDAHKDLLEQWLQWQIFNEMQDSNSSLHDASLSLLTRSGDERQKKRKIEEAKPKQKPKKPKTPKQDSDPEADEGSSDAGEDD